MRSFRTRHAETKGKLDGRKPFDKKLQNLECELMSWSECFIDLKKMKEMLEEQGLDIVEKNND